MGCHWQTLSVFESNLNTIQYRILLFFEMHSLIFQLNTQNWFNKLTHVRRGFVMQELLVEKVGSGDPKKRTPEVADVAAIMEQSSKKSLPRLAQETELSYGTC
jgi:hypothetical protein